jgi:hypothetical protein
MVLIMDEAERIFPGDHEVEEARKYARAMGALRVLGQSSSDRKLSIIAADLRPWLNRKNVLADGSTNPFFNFFQEVPLTLLTQFALGELVRGIGGATGVNRVHTEYIDELYSLSGGHPSIARMIAGASYKIRQQSHELSVKDIHAGLDEMAANDALGFFFRQNLWGLMTDAEKATLLHCSKTSGLQRIGDRMRSWLGGSRGFRNPEASASLNAQGILRQGEIAIGTFRDWIGEPGNVEA